MPPLDQFVGTPLGAEAVARGRCVCTSTRRRYFAPSRRCALIVDEATSATKIADATRERRLRLIQGGKSDAPQPVRPRRRSYRLMRTMSTARCRSCPSRVVHEYGVPAPARLAPDMPARAMKCVSGHIRSERWITYARAEAALLQLDDLLTFPSVPRIPTSAGGPTKQRQDHDPREVPSITSTDCRERNGTRRRRVPVLMVQTPAAPDESRFFGAILKDVGLPHLLPARAGKRQDAAVRLLQETRVRLLIIDEVLTFWSGSRLHQRRLLNLRVARNELQIPLEASGTAEALHAVQSDDQLAPIRAPGTAALGDGTSIGSC